MPVLKSLSFTALPKSANDPVQMRRAKFVARLEEQNQLLKDPNHVRTVQRWTIGLPQRPPTTKLSRVAGGAANAIRQLASAGDWPICVRGRLDRLPLARRSLKRSRKSVLREGSLPEGPRP